MRTASGFQLVCSLSQRLNSAEVLFASMHHERPCMCPARICLQFSRMLKKRLQPLKNYDVRKIADILAGIQKVVRYTKLESICGRKRLLR